MDCPACGQGNRDGAHFCDNCGSPLKRACPSCGADVRPAARFCDSCGAALETKPADLQTPEHLARKILEDRGRIEGERRTVTVLFADAKGFTPLSERLGEEKIYSFVQKCVELMVAGVHRHEGTVMQFTGDGIVALFGAPIAHEDSARRAVAASLDIQRALNEYIDGAGVDTAFRIGLNTGPVVVGRISDDLQMDYTAVGDTVNLAARMEQMCEPRAVFVTENTHRLVSDYFDFEDLGPAEVKGKSAPVHIYKAIGEKGVRTRLDAAIARGLSPFTGRDRELDMLKAFWKDALAGRGQIVLVSGEPGIGKSRLLLEFRRSLSEEIIWRDAQCVPYGEGIPYLPVVDLVKSGFAISDADDEGTIIGKVDIDTSQWTTTGQKTVPYLKFLLQVDPGDAAIESMGAVERRAGILDALRALILERSREAPRVVVVEDLHWADDASEEVFRVCADVVASSRVLMILTFRPGYMHPSGDLPNAHRIVLNDLDDEARRSLAAATLEAAALSADLAGPVTTKAEGNPLFIEEVSKALAAGAANTTAVPDSLQDVILARIDRLEGEAREALQLASVIGREFTLRLLKRISDVHGQLEGVLTELKTLELIYEKSFFPELAYMFKHALTHDVAYSTLLGERRKTLHRIVATAIEELYADRIAEHYETLAHHYSQAEVWDKALDYLELSADKAAAAFANAEAIGFYTRALELCTNLGDEQRAVGIAHSRGLVEFTIAHLDEAAASFERMATAARGAGDGRLEALARARWAMTKMIAHDFESAEAGFHESLDAAGTHQDVVHAASYGLAMMLLIINRHDEAAPYFDIARTIASRAGDDITMGIASEIEVIVPNWRGRYADALRQWRPSTGSGGGPAIEVMVNLAQAWAASLALGGAGRYEEAIETLSMVIAHAERVGDAFYRLRAMNSLGWVYLELQDVDRGREWNARMLDTADQLGLHDPEIDSNARLNLADVHIARGDLDAAEVELRRVEAIYRSPSPRDRWMLWRYAQHMLHSYGELHLLRGDGEKAAGYARECITLAEKSSALKNVIKGRRLLGRVHAARGNTDDAERELSAALDVARDVSNPTQLWKTYEAIADLCAASGRAAEASAAWSKAASVIDGVASALRDASLRSTFLGSPDVSRILAKR